ncbi:uncharacterized protein E0L32_000895 [Thyridium curvatum]|uniref:hydroxymethylglutaryl-CoA lyase n=1 Tax=Thyridium curvatum TaxID=1093900 RepID=A0A507B7H9_9PEZI|nr:uncharacterized protein E0L32_000895 [Thyridium curvatum]TPX12718.1 hypothetical protein E0L32_000895 [Thyridium curvatum]
MSPSAVRVVEVGPRDGLQNVKTSVPTEVKLELISRLRDTGLQSIEVTSVVSPKAIPQLADCRQVLASPTVKRLRREGANLRLPVLVPNKKGLQIALDYKVTEVAVFVSATEGFSRANLNCSVEEGLKRAREVASDATAAGIAVRGYVSCIFADPFDGPTPPSAVLRSVQELAQAGCYEVSLGDTLGVGTVIEVRNLITFLADHGVNLHRLAGHFHDTYGQALANVWQAYQCGIRVFDSSVGGLGGCPFAPGAKGNVATEDVVYLFHKAGVQTGVDLDKLAGVGSWISQQLSKPNDSRAGAAIVSKRKAASGKGSAVQKKASKLVWSLERDTGHVRVYRAGANGKIVLNNPKQGNVLNSHTLSQLKDAFTALEQDSTIARIVLSGTGKFFCTGMDLSQAAKAAEQGSHAASALSRSLTELFELVDNCAKPTIAVINGPVFGGGIGLAFACDIRLCLSSATFTLSEAKLGLCPAVISRYVIREWGYPLAREAMLTTRAVTAAELKSILAVQQVAQSQEALENGLESLLQSLRFSSPAGSAMSKQLVRLAWAHAGSDEQERNISQLFQNMLKAGGDGQHGIAEFQKRRRVDWDLYKQKKTQAKL